MVTSGTVQWCNTCGCFSENRATKRMQQACPGPPPQSAGEGGVRQQLGRLRAGLHPVTGNRLPIARDNCGNVFGGNGIYSRLKPGVSVDRDFSPYEPVTFAGLEPQTGQSADVKRSLMLGRVRYKQAKEARRSRNGRKKVAKAELRALIDSFVTGPILGAQSDTAIDSDEECRTTLPVDGSLRERLQQVSSLPGCNYSRSTSQVVRQNAGRKQPLQRLGRRCLVLTCYNFGCMGEHEPNHG